MSEDWIKDEKSFRNGFAFATLVFEAMGLFDERGIRNRLEELLRATVNRELTITPTAEDWIARIEREACASMPDEARVSMPDEGRLRLYKLCTGQPRRKMDAMHREGAACILTWLEEP
jgi:hypothetical protein